MHTNSEKEVSKSVVPQPAGTLAFGILLPIGGWLADAYLGRYRVIVLSMWIMWSGAMLNGLSFVTSQVNIVYSQHGYYWVTFFSKCIIGVGLCGFEANIIQFGIDQLSVASSTEITLFITWFIVTCFASGVMFYFGAYCRPEYAVVLVIAICLTIALSSIFLFDKWLVKEHVIKNPLPLIWKVIKYAVRRRQYWQRVSGLEEHGVLSRLNIAKSVYGGPCTNEEVEDVKSFFRIVAVVAMFMISCSGIVVTDTAVPDFIYFYKSNETCFVEQSVEFNTRYSVVVVTVILYKIIVLPLFGRSIPNITTTAEFIIAVLLFFASILTLLGFESATYFLEIENISYKISRLHWSILPNMLNGFSLFLVMLSGMQFVCAQAPYNMKGLLFGVEIALYGLGAVIQAGILQMFIKKHQYIASAAPLTPEIWFYGLQTVIVLLSFITVANLIRKYKRRERESALSGLSTSKMIHNMRLAIAVVFF